MMFRPGHPPAGLERFAALELVSYPRRVLVMAVAASVVLLLDVASKTVAVAVDPHTLLFNVSSRSAFGLVGGSLILVVAVCSLVACVLPSRVVAIGAGVALGGAVGNLTSRHWWASFGGSPDFIPLGNGSTGNVADLCIVAGGCAMLVGAFLWLGWTLAVARRTGELAVGPGSTGS